MVPNTSPSNNRPDAPSTRRINATAKLLAGHPDHVMRVLRELNTAELANVAEAARQIQQERAVAAGDLDQIIARGFEIGFGRDGLGLLPWVEGDVIVCPGAIVAKSKAGHRCRFVSVDDVWIWDSPHLVREDKRSNPGSHQGFRAVGLIGVVDGTAIDVVSGKARRSLHSVDRVVSYEVRRGELVEVSHRDVTAARAHRMA